MERIKIISLNTWAGRAGKKALLEFFAAHKDTDIFCLQEVWSAPFEHLEGVMAGGRELRHDEIMVHGKQEISNVLSDHIEFFHPQYKDDYGLMMLIHKKHKVLNVGEVFVHLYKGYEPGENDDVGRHARNIQYATIETDAGLLTIMNFHGLWNGQGKNDSDARLVQSDNIVTFIKTLSNPLVFCGDFNLKPETESIQKIEGCALRNLIREYGVTSTRTSHYTKQEKYADYVFVSSGIEVLNFTVLSDEVSDHAPLFVEIR